MNARRLATPEVPATYKPYDTVVFIVRFQVPAPYASWIPISEIKRENCFEDHYDILMYFLGKGK